MLRKKSLFVLLVLAMVSALVITGCKKDDQPAPSGAALGQITFKIVDKPAEAVLQLQDGTIDIWAFNITDQTLYETLIEDDRLDFRISYGSYSEIRFNHWGPTFEDGRFNPFHDHQIREAMNWLVDRDYIVDEYLGGLGEPKWTFLGKKFPDSAIRYPHIIAEIEEHYAHNPEKAKEVVTERMEALGAELKDGKWYYDGQPVTLIGLVRADLPPYPQAGHYFSGLLEDLGFTVEIKELPGIEANPIWTGTHPKDGQWSFYTGGWSSPSIPRDSAHTFDQFYTHRVMPYAVFTTLQDILEKDFPELDEASNRLRQKLFSTLEEREELFKTALWESMKMSNQIWICDKGGANPFRSNIRTAVDLAGGIGDPSWVFTTHRVDENNNIVMGANIDFGAPNLLLEPYNPVSGSSYTYDMLITRKALGDAGILPDPRDGLYHAKRIKSAHVVMEKGLPVEKTHDWVTLEFADEIKVPEDFWADWDAKEQRFITVGEKYPDGVTAKRKSVVVYPDDIFDRPLHDGSKLSVGDFVMAMIVNIDRGKPDSPIFDPSEEATVAADLLALKGFKITSTNPLTIETYSDTWYMDAEYNVSTWWPEYGGYAWGGYWHMIAVGCLAEEAQELAFSKVKADELSVDQMDYTKGESLPILKKHLDRAADTNYIPYAPTLGEYITEEEAAERWQNLQNFYEKYGHIWVGSGPYILKSVHAIEKVVVMEAFEAYPDPVDQWFFLLEELAAE